MVLFLYNDSNIYANEIYEYERGDAKCTDCTYETTWPGKVALSYPSDQAYGADLSSCLLSLYKYRECSSVNWMSSMSNGAVIEWLLTLDSSKSENAWYVSRGNVGCSSGGGYGGYGARPVFYLDSSLGLLSGDGSEGNPYVVG